MRKYYYIFMTALLHSGHATEKAFLSQQLPTIYFHFHMPSIRSRAECSGSIEDRTNSKMRSHCVEVCYTTAFASSNQASATRISFFSAIPANSKTIRICVPREIRES